MARKVTVSKFNWSFWTCESLFGCLELGTVMVLIICCLTTRISRGYFFLAGFFRISLDGLSDRGSTRSLFMIEKSDFEWFSLIERNCFGSRTSKYAQNFTQKIVQIQRKNQVLFVYHVLESNRRASPRPRISRSTSPRPQVPASPRPTSSSTKFPSPTSPSHF